MKPGVWSNVISNKINETRENLPCTWIFKKNKYYKIGNKYVEIQGICSICKTILVGVIPKEPDVDQDVKMSMKIGINEDRHKKR